MPSILPYREELYRLHLPSSCPWKIGDPSLEWARYDPESRKRIRIPTPLMDAFDAGNKIYALWLLEHGGVSLADRTSSNSTLLETVMTSLSLDHLGFFFNGPRSRKLGAPFVPAEYKTDGGSKVLRLFFDLNRTVEMAEEQQKRFLQCYL